MPRREDDFPEHVKVALAQLVCYICTYPKCRRLTAEAHSDPNKAVLTGEACHIHAASKGFAR